MPDPFYPSVNLDFIEPFVINSGKIVDDGIIKIGAITGYIVKGNQAIHKRTISVRELEPGQVCLEQATALALKFSFLAQLMQWLEQNRNWKEGAYIIQED